MPPFGAHVGVWVSDEARNVVRLEIYGEQANFRGGASKNSNVIQKLAKVTITQTLTVRRSPKVFSHSTFLQELT